MVVRMLRPEWAEKYVVGNPLGNRLECRVFELEEWERNCPCSICDMDYTICINICDCSIYDKWFSEQPLKRPK